MVSSLCTVGRGVCGAGVTLQIKPASEWLTTELRNSCRTARLAYTTERFNAAKKRLESLKADEGLDVAVANGRSSAAQGERLRQASLVQELESQVQYLEQRMKNLEDEGRKAGALPGWFR